MNTPYFTLATRDDATSPFAPQFGDYDRDVVVQERIDSYSDVKRANYVIIRTGDAHDEIDAAIAKLNAK